MVTKTQLSRHSDVDNGRRAWGYGRFTGQAYLKPPLPPPHRRYRVVVPLGRVARSLLRLVTIQDRYLTLSRSHSPVYRPHTHSSTMGLSVSRLLQGLFGKKEMRK